MQTMPIRLLLVLVALVLAAPSTLTAAASRTALVIGNGAYSHAPLRNPVHDATDMAAALERSGFTVILRKNASLREMEEAIEHFGNRLKRGGVGLFYYAGHGVQVNGINYLLPVGARINKESDIKYEAVDTNRILDEMASANNGLNIVMLDACRDNPFATRFRSASRGLAIVGSAPTGTFISYSTGPGQVARDGEGRNSPYTSALLQHMKEPGISITDMFMKIRQKLQRETGQVPWELSSLVGSFAFVPGKGGPSGETTGLAAIEHEPGAERARPEADRAQLQREKETVEQRRVLDEAKARLEEEKKALAMGRPPSPVGPKEIRRDGSFIAYDDGTVLDTKTTLMWAAKDNGTGINWSGAKSYCASYRGGGYADWRMPTRDELAELYEPNQRQANEEDPSRPLHLTELIDLTSCCPWTSETRGDEAASFYFHDGKIFWLHKTFAAYYRALPVRSVK